MYQLLDPMELGVEARNRYFEALSKRERAILVAKDALAQAASGRYSIMSTYLVLHEGSTSVNLQEVKSMQEFLTKPNSACNVCAIGAAFASVVRLGNKCEGSDFINTGYVHELLRQTMRAFTLRELQVMEYLFEGFWATQTHLKSKMNFFDKMKVESYYRTNVGNMSRNGRFNFVMQLIIANNGRVVVPGIHLSSTKRDKN